MYISLVKIFRYMWLSIILYVNYMCGHNDYVHLTVVTGLCCVLERRLNQLTAHRVHVTIGVCAKFAECASL